MGKGHLGDSCIWSRESGSDGCKDRHHRLLHEENVGPGSMEGKADTLATEENKSTTYETVQEHAQRIIALRTVPVVLKHGERRLHPIWKCDVFKGMEHRKKWETAKKLGLCYRCLEKKHLGDSCTWSRESGIDGCKDRHHRLLHEEKVAPGSMEGKANTPVSEENKSSAYETVQKHAQTSVALRTVQIVLKHGERRLQVNCFLDEGIDTSYVNEDVIEELGFGGRKEKVIINVANGQKVNLMSATMEIGLESLGGRRTQLYCSENI